MDALHINIKHAKKLIYDKKFIIVDHVIEMLAKVQIALHTLKVLQEKLDKTMALIFKVHSNFL